MYRVSTTALLTVLVMGATACQQVKSSSPLSDLVAGPMAGVQMDAPKLLLPENGRKLKANQQPIPLLIENPATNTPRPWTLKVEISMDETFGNPVFAQGKIAPGEGGQTTFVLPSALQVGRRYYWRAQAGDGANVSPFSSVMQFEVLEPVVIQAPTPTSPVGNQQLTTRRPTLTVLNASKSGPFKTPVIYYFEVSTDQAFGNRVVFEERFEDTFQTQLASPHDLAASTTHFWRSRATDGEVTGPWSVVESFRTAAAAPVPPPGGGGGGGGGTPCVGPLSPLGILECERAKYGSPMSPGEAVEFLRNSAKAFNIAGVPGGPWGILRKESGNNCGGYSCDILCTGQGSQQQQYDVLIDGEAPTFGGPIEGGIRVDFCEIQ